MGRRQKQTSGNNSGSKDKPEEDEQKIKARREKTRLKVQAWRKKQRENKAKHEELKRVDRERRKDARLLKKHQSLSDSNLQQELRRKKHEEMKRYRQKKKEKAALALSVNKSIDLRSPKTAELSRKKKEAVKRTQAWRMCIKLNESIQQECIQTDCEIGNTGSARDSPMNKVLPKATLYRQLKKVKEVLPNTPKRKAVIISKLIESPSTSKFLNRNKMIMTPDCQKNLN